MFDAIAAVILALAYAWGAMWAYEFARVRGLAVHVVLAQGLFALAFHAVTGTWFGPGSIPWVLYTVAIAVFIPFLDRELRQLEAQKGGTIFQMVRRYRSLSRKERMQVEELVDTGLDLEQALDQVELMRMGEM